MVKELCGEKKWKNTTTEHFQYTVRIIGMVGWFSCSFSFSFFSFFLFLRFQHVFGLVRDQPSIQWFSLIMVHMGNGAGMHFGMPFSVIHQIRALFVSFSSVPRSICNISNCVRVCVYLSLYAHVYAYVKWLAVFSRMAMKQCSRLSSYHSCVTPN